jgi:hypothetical protein
MIASQREQDGGKGRKALVPLEKKMVDSDALVSARSGPKLSVFTCTLGQALELKQAPQSVTSHRFFDPKQWHGIFRGWNYTVNVIMAYEILVWCVGFVETAEKCGKMVTKVQHF